MELTDATWRKSTYSGGDNACVEVAQVWRRSGLVRGQDVRSEAVAPGFGSARSSVEEGSERVFVLRDSKNPEGAMIYLTEEMWNAFLVSVRSGDFDHLASE